MSTPWGLREELVNSLSQRVEVRGRNGCGGSAVSRATQRGGLRGCAWEEGWEEAGVSLARLCTPPLELTGWVEVPLCLGSTLRSPQNIPLSGPSV